MKDLEEQLLEAARMVALEGGAPQDMFVPDYGWVLIDGKPTDIGIIWYQKEVLKNGE